MSSSIHTPQQRPYDEFFSACSSQFMALGGVLYLQLLVPSGAAHRKGPWQLRQVTGTGRRRCGSCPATCIHLLSVEDLSQERSAAPCCV